MSGNTIHKYINIFEKHLSNKQILKYKSWIKEDADFPSRTNKEEKALFNIYKEFLTLHPSETGTVEEKTSKDHKTRIDTVYDSDSSSDMILSSIKNNTRKNKPTGTKKSSNPFDALFGDEKEDTSLEEIKQQISGLENFDLDSLDDKSNVTLDKKSDMDKVYESSHDGKSEDDASSTVSHENIGKKKQVPKSKKKVPVSRNIKNKKSDFLTDQYGDEKQDTSTNSSTEKSKLPEQNSDLEDFVETSSRDLFDSIANGNAENDSSSNVSNERGSSRQKRNGSNARLPIPASKRRVSRSNNDNKTQNNKRTNRKGSTGSFDEPADAELPVLKISTCDDDEIYANSNNCPTIKTNKCTVVVNKLVLTEEHQKQLNQLSVNAESSTTSRRKAKK